MPEDGFYIGVNYRGMDDGNTLDTGIADDFDMKSVDMGDSSPVHEIAWDKALYDLDGETDAKSLQKETELSLRFAEGDNFKLHLG